jgi:hypothetical protein
MGRISIKISKRHRCPKWRFDPAQGNLANAAHVDRVILAPMNSDDLTGLTGSLL